MFLLVVGHAIVLQAHAREENGKNLEKASARVSIQQQEHHLLKTVFFIKFPEIPNYIHTNVQHGMANKNPSTTFSETPHTP